MRNILLLILLLALGSCTSVPSSSKEESVSLENTHWILDENLNTNNEITLSIEQSKVSGNSSCNNYFGTLVYEVSTKEFSVKNVGVTRKACQKMIAENYFLEALEKVNKYQITQGNLELYKDNILILRFKRK